MPGSQEWVCGHPQRQGTDDLGEKRGQTAGEDRLQQRLCDYTLPGMRVPTCDSWVPISLWAGCWPGASLSPFRLATATRALPASGTPCCPCPSAQWQCLLAEHFVGLSLFAMHFLIPKLFQRLPPQGSLPLCLSPSHSLAVSSFGGTPYLLLDPPGLAIWMTGHHC